MLHVSPPCNLTTGSSVGGKTRHIAIQLVLQQCWKTSSTFFVGRFTVAEETLTTTHLHKQSTVNFPVTFLGETF